jgi:quercetin dioxygenase-like cupin family protein
MPSKEIINLGDIEVKFSLDANDTNQTMTMFTCSVKPAAKMVAPHYHKHFDETVYGLTGVVSYILDGKPVDVGPGEALFIPRGAVHGFENKQNGPIEFLVVCSPGVFGPQYFKDIAAVLAAGGPPDLNKIKQVMDKHGLVPVG